MDRIRLDRESFSDVRRDAMPLCYTLMILHVVTQYLYRKSIPGRSKVMLTGRSTTKNFRRRFVIFTPWKFVQVVGSHCLVGGHVHGIDPSDLQH